ncbi:MAG: hypothetical protein J6U64_00490 [Alphaproteobacteria bacterium]|nr:hypothetical protein [Alphaproteobacteria bacterium]
MTDKKKLFDFGISKDKKTDKEVSINVRFAGAVKKFLMDEGLQQELFIEAKNDPKFNPNYVSSGRTLLEMSIYKFNLPAAEFLLKNNARVTKTAIRLANIHSFKTVFGKQDGGKFMSLLNSTWERQKEEEARRPKGNLFEEAGRFLLNKIKGMGR